MALGRTLDFKRTSLPYCRSLHCIIRNGISRVMGQLKCRGRDLFPVEHAGQIKLLQIILAQTGASMLPDGALTTCLLTFLYLEEASLALRLKHPKRGT